MTQPQQPGVIVITELSGAERVLLDTGGSQPSETTTQDIANIAPSNALPLTGGTMTGTIHSNVDPALSLTNTGGYDAAGQIRLDDLGSIKIGTAPNTSGAPMIVSVVQEVTSNFHSYDDTSTWTPTTAGRGAASFNAQITVNASGAAVDHANAFQDNMLFNLDSGNLINSHTSYNTGFTLNGPGTLTNFIVYNAADPTETNTPTLTNFYALSYTGTGKATYNFFLWQSQATSGAKGPFNVLYANLGLGITFPNIGLHIKSTYVVGFDNGSGTADVKLSRPAAALLQANVPTIIGISAGYTIAAGANQLPAASATYLGARTFVNDFSGTPTWNAALGSGGGTTVLPVFCNGSAWVQG